MKVESWLSALDPPPPPALLESLRDALERIAVDGDISEACVRAAELLLSELISTDSSDRKSALPLLTADALLTYALEFSPAHVEERATEIVGMIGSASRAVPA